MKKIIYFLLLVNIILLSIFTTDILKEKNTNQTLYKDSSVITLTFSDTTKQYSYNAFDYIEYLAEKYDTTISQLVYKDSKSINIYTTNKKYYDNNKNVINLIDKTKKIHLYELKSKNISPEGRYLIYTTNKEKIKKIIKKLNDNVGIAKYQGENTYKIFNPNYYIFSLFLLLMCILIFSIYHYFIITNYQNKILKDLGYKSYQILILKFKTNLFSIMYTQILALLFVYILFYYINGFISITFIGINTLMVSFFLYILIFVIYSIIMNICISKYKLVQIKNNISFLYLIFFIVFLILIIPTSNNLINEKKLLDSLHQENKKWNITQNIYTPTVTSNGEHESNKLTEKTGYRAKKLFFASDLPGFIINTNNFFFDGLEFNYEANEINNNNLEPLGKTILVDKNYLKYVNKNIEYISQIKIDNNIRNIMVPVKFEKFKNIIYKNFLKDFHFKKCEISKSSKCNMEQLDINIIWIKNNNYYPTFNLETGNKNNEIKDPILEIETGNIDNSYYFSYLTNSYYLKSKSNDPFNQFKPELKKYKLDSNVHSINSVFNEKGERIDKILKEITTNSIITIVLIIIVITLLISMINIYFDTNKFRFYIKSNLGYTFLQIHKIPLLLLGIIIFIFIFSIIVIGNLYSILIGIIIIFLLLIIAFISFKNYNNKSFNEITKGNK